jgi:iron complex transport system permease protein
MLTYGQVAAVGEALVWMAGSVYARGFEHVRLLVLWVGLLAPLACLLARHLDVLDLGDDVARGLGLRVARLRGMLLVLGVGLAGAAVAAAGTVGFVGLLAPHMARRVAGVSHRHLVPAGALIGALVTVLADTVGRTLFAPIELPCGVLTAAFGAPYLIARLAGGPGR